MKKNSRLLLIAGFILALLLIFYLQTNLAAADTPRAGAAYYKDIGQGDWSYGAVSELSRRGLINGYPDGTFRPEKTVTFGEFIKMMALAARPTSINVAPGSWLSAFYDQGLKQGLYSKWDIDENDLAKPIARKYMALIIGSALGERKIENYAALQKTIRDVKAGDEYEYDMMKAYDAGILTGYPDGTFGPNGTLTRAEAAVAVCRFVSKRPGPVDSEYAAMESWYNGSNVSTHADNTYWLENQSFKPQVRGQFLLKNGKLYMSDILGMADAPNQAGWTMRGLVYKDVNQDIYKVLKAYWKIAEKDNYFITVSGGKGILYDTISISLSERDAPNFPRTSSFSFNDGNAPLVNETQVFVTFDMGMNYKLSQFEEFAASAPDWRERFLDRGRILDESLVQLNKNLMIEIYGQSVGSKLYDFALSKYKRLYEKEESGAFLQLINLDNEGKNIEGIAAYFDDDATSRTTIYIGKQKGE